ncbi:hypothetical protein [Nonomuraea cavernae]|uniref:Uncharacterized protein n=1 Tax=Nonomuraea cavernae TaxID=2045107 RepID=A0A917YPV9_9ACTN|nr:hypothetical protein [Nonomuraea cavernae]MCA2184573.1 hypothetical protein [Nonomuraea cavernae]GGO63382.1 hypothetical protein GCM10012289_10310 [Nonomuraea cavernae]
MEQTILTPLQSGDTKLLTAKLFLDELIAWTDANLDTITGWWANPGEGWEDSLRTAFTLHLQKKYLWADLGAPLTRNVYPTAKMACDWVLNGTVAARASDKVIVEVKVQTIDAAKNFRSNFENDIEKLDKVDTAYADCLRLAIGVFFTRDYDPNQKKSAPKPKKAHEPMESAGTSQGFTKWLNAFHHVYFSDTYNPDPRKPGSVTATRVRKAGAIHSDKGGEGIVRAEGVPLTDEDVSELGIVWALLPSKNELRRQQQAEKAAQEKAAQEKRGKSEKRAREETDSDQEEGASSSDSVFEKKPPTKRANTTDK